MTTLADIELEGRDTWVEIGAGDYIAQNKHAHTVYIAATDGGQPAGDVEGHPVTPEQDWRSTAESGKTWYARGTAGHLITVTTGI